MNGVRMAFFILLSYHLIGSRHQMLFEWKDGRKEEGASEREWEQDIEEREKKKAGEAKKWKKQMNKRVYKRVREWLELWEAERS